MWDAASGGISSMFGQPRRLAAFAVLLAVVLGPALPATSPTARGYVLQVAVTTLAITTFVTPGRTTARFGLGWFLGATIVILATSGGPYAIWIWPILLAISLPATALLAAAWSLGSWHSAARVIGRRWRRSWLGAIGTTIAFSVVAGILLGLPAFAIAESLGERAGAVAYSVAAAISQTIFVALAVGYTNSALMPSGD